MTSLAEKEGLRGQGPDDLHRPALRDQVRLELAGLDAKARREGRQGRRRDPRSRSRSRRSATPGSSGSTPTSRTCATGFVVARELLTESGSHLRSDRRRERAPRPLRCSTRSSGARTSSRSSRSGRRRAGSPSGRTCSAGTATTSSGTRRDRGSVEVPPALPRRRSSAASGATQYTLVELPDGAAAPGDVETGTRERARVTRSSRTGRPHVRRRAGARTTSLPGSSLTDETFRPGEGALEDKPRGNGATARSGPARGRRNTLSYVRYLDDFPAFPLNNVWDGHRDRGSSADPKVYVVQTNTKVVERCLLMTTDPGDLVLDPTCGSGTTAVVGRAVGPPLDHDRHLACRACARPHAPDGRPLPLLRAPRRGRRRVQGFDCRDGPARHPQVDRAEPGHPRRHEPEEIEAASRDHAEQETLYDQPLEDKKVRVTGPVHCREPLAAPDARARGRATERSPSRPRSSSRRSSTTCARRASRTRCKRGAPELRLARALRGHVGSRAGRVHRRRRRRAHGRRQRRP